MITPSHPSDLLSDIHSKPGYTCISESQPSHQVWPFLALEVNGKSQAPLVDADDRSYEHIYSS